VKTMREFGAFQEPGCKDLKGMLMDMEARSGKIGRVRLPDFYNRSLWGSFKTNEREDYLRALGALDESNPQVKYVITTNYILSRPNCMDASSIHAVCCHNECEDLMKRIETIVAKPYSDLGLISDVIKHLASDTVQAPRELPPSLLDRLKSIASANGGQIHLHGRLFAQFMHHAFPRECSYPHQMGSISPQDSYEWVGSTQTSASLSTEELQERVALDVCPAQGPCDLDSKELPWNDLEEMYADDREVPFDPSLAPIFDVPTLALILIVVILSIRKVSPQSKSSRVYKYAKIVLIIFGVLTSACIWRSDPAAVLVLVFGVSSTYMMTFMLSRNAQCSLQTKLKVDDDDFEV